MDKARIATDKKLGQMEKELTKIYKKSRNGIVRKWNAYMDKASKELKPLQDDYDKAKLSGDADLIKSTGIELSKAKRDITLNNKYYKNMVEGVAEDLANVNQKAVNYINGNMPNIYTMNYNSINADLDKLNIKYDLVDEHTVKRMILDGEVKVPKKKMNIPKDMRWNTKQINSGVLQGIIQGDSIDTISKKLFPVMMEKADLRGKSEKEQQSIIRKNEQSAIRNARTMTTSAENHGRLDRYKDLEERGIVMNKVWIATADDRTREEHLNMDGEEVGIDEEFSNGCMFPGDEAGPPETVWNCRCSMRTHIIGFKKRDGSISYVEDEREETLHNTQIAQEIARRDKEEKDSTEHNVVRGKDISDTWKRRLDKFDFEIEDVINAQGFDGLPRVVDAEEFDRYVQEANDGKGFIAQRTYSAPDQETLDAYREQLYDGKWYVDCSTGGAQYGQGMYCAADYSGHITDGIKAEMKHYKELGSERNPESAKKAYNDYITNAINNTDNEIEKAGLKVKFSVDTDEDYSIYSKRTREQDRRISKLAEEIEEGARIARDQGISYTETFTLDKTAKIIKYEKLEQMRLDDVGRFYKTNKKRAREIDRMDLGSYASLKGYDAINAEGHGESGSYTVILNRTKVIFKGGKKK